MGVVSGSITLLLHLLRGYRHFRNRTRQPRTGWRLANAARRICCQQLGGPISSAKHQNTRSAAARWGATPAEVDATLPGDEVVVDPVWQSTRAIDIAAPVSDVWPWLAQMGQDRGGLYSYDWLENIAGLDFHNADHIVPEWQDVQAGDFVRFAPEQDTLVVAASGRRGSRRVRCVACSGCREHADVIRLSMPGWTRKLPIWALSRAGGSHRCGGVATTFAS
jgi:hypothetical protein